MGTTIASVCWGTNISTCFRARPCNSGAQAQASVLFHACVRVWCIGGTHTDCGLVCGSNTSVHRVVPSWRSPCAELVVNYFSANVLQAVHVPYSAGTVENSVRTSCRHLTEAEDQPRAHAGSSRGNTCFGDSSGAGPACIRIVPVAERAATRLVQSYASRVPPHRRATRLNCSLARLRLAPPAFASQVPPHGASARFHICCKTRYSES